jgi:hypothetical protein
MYFASGNLQPSHRSITIGRRTEKWNTHDQCLTDVNEVLVFLSETLPPCLVALSSTRFMSQELFRKTA